MKKLLLFFLSILLITSVKAESDFSKYEITEEQLDAIKATAFSFYDRGEEVLSTAIVGTTYGDTVVINAIEVDGYTVSPSSISVTPNQSNQDVTFHYEKKKGTVNVNYIDEEVPEPEYGLPSNDDEEIINASPREEEKQNPDTGAFVALSFILFLLVILTITNYGKKRRLYKV